MTDQHTPGPWPAPEEDCGSGGSWYDIDGICRFVSKEADARLIAAAPELLAALEEMFDTDPSCTPSTKAMKMGRAAIAKATGSAE
jgi:hypothetical protein